MRVAVKLHRIGSESEEMPLINGPGLNRVKNLRFRGKVKSESKMSFATAEGKSPEVGVAP
jgi:hypothetical protein